MKRRTFLKTSVVAGSLAGVVPAAWGAAVGEPAAGREYYELRVYHLKDAGSRPLLDTYLEKALLPALNRLGSRPVGVFSQQERPGKPVDTELVDPAAVVVLIPYPTLDAFGSAGARLNADSDYQKAGASYLEVAKEHPAFQRIDSWLLLAFAGMPKIEQPAYSLQRKPRLFEIRTYESYSEAKALKKVDMFNSGEIATMREVGLAPIFYGQALIGANLPHLTYMLSAEDQPAHTKHWDAFKQHPAWDKLKNDPKYADTVSKIANRFVIPTAYSQI
jgi:hypothetical protein